MEGEGMGEKGREGEGKESYGRGRYMEREG